MKYEDKNENERWYEGLVLAVSYGEVERVSPLIDYLEFDRLALSADIPDFDDFVKLTLDEQRKSMVVIYSNEDKTVNLQIPVDKLMEYQTQLEKTAYRNNMKGTLGLEDGMTLEELGATLESVDKNGNRTYLGINYTVFPTYFDMDREREKEFSIMKRMERDKRLRDIIRRNEEIEKPKNEKTENDKNEDFNFESIKPIFTDDEPKRKRNGEIEM